MNDAAIRATVFGVVATSAVALAALLVPACSSDGTTCDCSDPGITLSVPSDIASAVDKVVLSGPACDGVTASCATGTGCTTYRFDGSELKNTRTAAGQPAQQSVSRRHGTDRSWSSAPRRQ